MLVKCERQMNKCWFLYNNKYCNAICGLQETGLVSVLLEHHYSSFKMYCYGICPFDIKYKYTACANSAWQWRF